VAHSNGSAIAGDQNRHQRSPTFIRITIVGCTGTVTITIIHTVCTCGRAVAAGGCWCSMRWSWSLRRLPEPRIPPKTVNILKYYITTVLGIGDQNLINIWASGG